MNVNDYDLVIPANAVPDHAEVLEAVSEEAWQDFRKRLKGKSTEYKVGALDGWLIGSRWAADEDALQRKVPKELRWLDAQYVSFMRRRRVQVHNYIGALKRGGQLSAAGEVLK